MANTGEESISIGNYLLERLSQIGVQARSYPLLYYFFCSQLSSTQSLFGVPGDFNLGFLVCPTVILYVPLS
ncbi:hypothetical protein F5148DRAFT_1261300 [Russula earlei]|uniref:Uncharacterized protein n=1 Tax=Russula earlei TaxID=71964 RepID=A0ACC0TT22_9AGAM|nr:hypothetical protein F5148DRAFT_1261300 [Russula earlei]